MIYNEDCLRTVGRFDDCSIDLVVTSPPYNLGKKHHTGNNSFDAYDEYVDDIPENEYQEWQLIVLNNLYRILKDGGSLIYNHKNRIKGGVQISPYEWIFKSSFNIKQELIWFNRGQNFDKIRFYPMTERIYWLSKGVDTGFVNNINQHDIFRDLPSGTDLEHKRSFPVDLVRKFIVCFPHAKKIYDPFMGSGTTAIACIKEGREYFGSEISKSYYDFSIDRINKEKSQLNLF